MNSQPQTERWTLSDAIGVLARWFCGGLFVYMGLVKALEPPEFLKLVRQYDVVSNSLLLNSIAAGLPWFEVFCGLLLLAGVAVRGAALMLVVMLVPFTLLVFRHALDIAHQQGQAFCTISFDCGCGTGEEAICNKMIMNGLLILVAAWVIAGKGRRLCARFSLLPIAGAKSEDAGSSLQVA